MGSACSSTANKADQAQAQAPVPQNALMSPVVEPMSGTFDASFADQQQAVEYENCTMCIGDHCPPASHVEIAPGVYQSLSDPTDIIDTRQNAPAPSVRQSRLSAAAAAEMRPSGNNIIVAPVLEAPVLEAPVEAEKLAEEPAKKVEEAPPKQKRTRRVRKKNPRGADETEVW